jgi:hypothetical protein
MMEGGCAPYRACRSRLVIAVLHMVLSSASACTNTVAGKPTRGGFGASPVGVKWLQRPPPMQLARQSGACDPRCAHSLALGGSRVFGDSLWPIPVAVHSSTAKDLRWRGTPRSTLAGSASRPARETIRAHPPASLEQHVPAGTLRPCLL